MTRIIAALIGSLCIAALAACSSQGSTTETPLLVLGASSTRVLNEEMQQQWEGGELTFSNAGSSLLVQQITEGAPADLLITADAATMQRAVEAGVVDTPVALATNQLVIVAAPGNPLGITGLSDLGNYTTVICDPTVPCGAATQKLLDKEQIALTPASMESAVADVVSKVATGSADAGLVYRTDAKATQVDAIEIPAAAEFTTTVMGAVVTQSSNKSAAQNLLEFLRSDFVHQWAEHGFGPSAP